MVDESQPAHEHQDEVGDQIRFHFIKGGGFRVIHVNGAFGGITPRGEIHAAVYNERSPIPKEVVHRIDDDGRLGEITGTVSREGIVREVEVDLMMSPKVARQFGEWLLQNAALAEIALAESENDDTEGRGSIES